MIITIDKSRSDNLTQQITDEIIRLIKMGAIKEGEQLPSSRVLAQQLGVNRTTVVRAYEELWAQGYTESSAGSYTRVRLPMHLSGEKSTGKGKPITWKHGLGSAANSFAMLVSSKHPNAIDFQRLEPDSRLIDQKVFASCYRNAAASSEQSIFGYSHPQGYQPLRHDIAKHMQLHGINTTPQNVLVTNGAQNSLQLIFQAYVTSSDTIAVESPTYSMLIPLIKHYNPKVIEIPVLKDGMDVDFLADTLSKHSVKLVYTMPTFHNPTGTTMPQHKRERLLSLCQQHGLMLIEDSIEEELKYFGRVHLPIKSMDSGDNVIYLGSFSKILAPGLRTGWIIAHPDCISQLSGLKTVLDLSSNTLSQAMLHHFCSDGHYELHIRKMLKAYKKRMTLALRLLKQELPKSIAHWNEPLGGYLIWIEINTELDEPSLLALFQKHGVMVSGGNAFFFSQPGRHYIRISISKSDTNEIEEGIRRMGSAVRELANPVE